MRTDPEQLKHTHINRPIRSASQSDGAHLSPAAIDGSFTKLHGRGHVQQSHRQSHQRFQDASIHNVSENERVISVIAGAALAGLGLAKRDLTGLLLAGVGGALAYRGATGHCSVYESFGIDTSEQAAGDYLEKHGVHVIESMLISKPSDQLYQYWCGFEKLPSFMSHLKSVRRIDDKQSEWVAAAPGIIGGEVSWVATVTTDHPNNTIAWETVPGSDVVHRGQVTFTRAPGDRGTYVRVELQYAPPAGQLGKWLAALFGEQPEQQIRSDLRKFKHLMETGEIPTVEGQPRGKCSGVGNWFGN